MAHNLIVLSQEMKKTRRLHVDVVMSAQCDHAIRRRGCGGGGGRCCYMMLEQSGAVGNMVVR